MKKAKIASFLLPTKVRRMAKLRRQIGRETGERVCREKKEKLSKNEMFASTLIGEEGDHKNGQCRLIIWETTVQGL